MRKDTAADRGLSQAKPPKEVGWWSQVRRWSGCQVIADHREEKAELSISQLMLECEESVVGRKGWSRRLQSWRGSKSTSRGAEIEG
jgi:hypothetical protein